MFVFIALVVGAIGGFLGGHKVGAGRLLPRFRISL